MKITTRPLHHKNENYNKALKKMKITTRIKKEKKIRTRIKKWKLQRDCSTTKMKITTRPLVHSKYQVLLLPSFLNSQSSRIWSFCLLLIKINQCMLLIKINQWCIQEIYGLPCFGGILHVCCNNRSLYPQVPVLYKYFPFYVSFHIPHNDMSESILLLESPRWCLAFFKWIECAPTHWKWMLY